jgi:hypothetical protein
VCGTFSASLNAQGVVRALSTIIVAAQVHDPRPSQDLKLLIFCTACCRAFAQTAGLRWCRHPGAPRSGRTGTTRSHARARHAFEYYRHNHQAAAGEFLLDSGIDWEQWTDDADERIAEAAQSLIDLTRRSGISLQPKQIVLKPILPLVETESTPVHIIPSPTSSRAASPLQPPSSSRIVKLPSKQVLSSASCSVTVC